MTNKKFMKKYDVMVILRTENLYFGFQLGCQIQTSLVKDFPSENATGIPLE